MRSHLCVLTAILVGTAAQATAGTLVDVGTHDLLPNTDGQIVELFAEVDPPDGRDPDQVTGFNLRAQIGDGMGPVIEPVFSQVDFSNAIWDAHESQIVGEAPVETAPQFAQIGVVFLQSQRSVPASGKIATLVIDTTGINAGSFDLLLSETEIGFPSEFLSVDVGVGAATPFEPRIINGTLRVVPEPVGATSLAMALLLLHGRFRPRR